MRERCRMDEGSKKEEKGAAKGASLKVTFRLAMLITGHAV
jgi:hypothetical protein